MDIGADPQIDIYQFDYGFDVAISRMRIHRDGAPARMGRQCGPVTRSTLIRAQRMQLKLYDLQKRSPNGEAERPLAADDRRA